MAVNVDAARNALQREMDLLEMDNHLLPSERDLCKVEVLGNVSARPKDFGQARRLIACYRDAIKYASTEIPF